MDATFAELLDKPLGQDPATYDGELEAEYFALMSHANTPEQRERFAFLMNYLEDRDARAEKSVTDLPA